MTRISRSERIIVANRAEQAIMQYARADPETGLRPHALWHKHVHNVELDPVQVLKMVEMDQHPNSIDVSCRRTGKTACKEIYLLEHNATMPHQTVGIVAPRQQQSQNNLNYHLDAIRRSEMLRAYVAYKQGREQISDTKYQFSNGSGAAAYGIMAQIDGDALTAASLEETDDMPSDRLLSRFLPMLGAARRLGVDQGTASFKPQVRITGVFKGADVLQGLIDSGGYHLLPAVDVYLGIELGILNEKFMLDMRSQMPEGEFIRQFLCLNVASQNWIWEKYIRRAMAVGLSAGLAPAEPLPGGRYRKRGMIAFGYDHSGHGESATASRSALVVKEQIGNFLCTIFVKTWPAGTDDKVVELDLFGFWSYFRPDFAMGDAYGLGMLTSLNDRLFAGGLVDVDRRTIGEGESTASTWDQWPFAPIRFQGYVKHSMASALRTAFHNGQAAIAYFDDGTELVADAANGKLHKVPLIRLDANSDGSADWRTYVRQVANIKAEATKADYSSFKMADPKVGDDLFDADCAATWALATRGVSAFGPTVIEQRTQTREQLLGESA
ncbi:MAG: hypothetical protein HY847_01345 [Betaproteobacteria bacterium]|nr:hypothetical protein [Betaproteobacteria bacterium]